MGAVGNPWLSFVDLRCHPEGTPLEKDLRPNILPWYIGGN